MSMIMDASDWIYASDLVRQHTKAQIHHENAPLKEPEVAWVRRISQREYRPRRTYRRDE